jgi:hypothetical protein
MLTATIHVQDCTLDVLDICREIPDCPECPERGILIALRSIGVVPLIPIVIVGADDFEVPVCWTPEEYVRRAHRRGAMVWTSCSH